MQQKSHVSHVSFIPKGKDTFRPSQNKEIISQFIFSSEFTIGSSKEASIIYKAKGVHSLHAKVHIEGRNIFITDLFSDQGISVNGNKITAGEKFPLRSGECFQLGNSKDLIRVDLFRMATDPQEEANQIIQEARSKAREIRKETDKIFAEAKEVDHKTQLILKDAEAKAEKIVSEKTNEVQKDCEEVRRKTIEEAHEKAKAILSEAEKNADEMIYSVESKSADLIKKRDIEAKSILDKAYTKSDELIASGKSEVEAMITAAKAEAKEIVSSGEVEKQTVLTEKLELERRITELHKKKEDIKKNTVELHKENAIVKERNAELVAEEKKFTGKYDAAKADFEEKKSKLEKEREAVQADLDEHEQKLKNQKSELNKTNERNIAALRDLQATEDVQRTLKASIETKTRDLAQLKDDIIAAENDKKLALEEAEKQREKTSSSIKELKKQFEDQYQRRKAAEEERFISIRKRETQASEERRRLLKKQEKERIPYQIETISASIWNDLSVELQDQQFCKEVFESESKIPLGIEKIVTKSLMEEFDLRSRVAASVPTYLEKSEEPEPKEETEIPIAPLDEVKIAPAKRSMSQGMTMIIIGAFLAVATIYGLSMISDGDPEAQRNLSSEAAPAEVAPKKPGATSKRSRKSRRKGK